ncbi:MAG TPA: helix-hairpin-helix domain-containing protein, partial [Halococcus sp.]|nr:helix-hairpin-helix domain-containing protein [Halococcus sp.]
PGEVTGPESGSDVDSAETTGSDGERKNAAAAGGDAADSTGSMTEEDETDVAAEPGEAAGPESEDADLELDHSGAESSDESDADTTASEGVGVDETADDAAAAGADAAGSTGSMTEETNESISATEDAEAVGPTGEEPTGETDDHAVDVLKGIGPSYGEQLESAGVETIADLAAADAEELTAELDISESRIERWVERAKARRQ